jgi:hypothetical protein
MGLLIFEVRGFRDRRSVRVRTVNVVQHPCPVGELTQVQVAAVVQLEKDRPIRRQSDVSGLRGDALKDCRTRSVSCDQSWMTVGALGASMPVMGRD